MVKLIDGRILAEKIKDNVVQEIIKLGGARPNLAIILIGNRDDSELYVSLKEKEAKKVGIDTHLYRCDECILESEIIEIINHLNQDELIDAILIQLPLPEKFNTDKIIKTIDPRKDVDRFHPENVKAFMETCDHNHLMPPLFNVIFETLKSINCSLENKEVCALCNSDLFGDTLSKALECRQAKVNIVHKKNPKLKEITSKADILITALGEPNFIKKEMIKEGAIIIDIGITKKEKTVCGDVDFEDVKEKAGYLTPVPGGVGPMTIAEAFKNTLEIYKQRKKNEQGA